MHAAGRTPPCESRSLGGGGSRLFLALLLALGTSAGLTLGAEDLAGSGFSAMPLFPLTMGMAPYPEAGSGLLEPGRFRLNSSLTWANTLRVEDGFRLPGYLLTIDAETLSLRQSFEIGIVQGLEFGTWVEGAALFGGILDGPLSWFHHIFGFANQWRDYVAPGRVLVSVSTPGGSLPELSETSAGLHAIGFSLRCAPLRSLPLAAELWVKLPPPLGLPLPLTSEPAWGLSLGSELHIEDLSAAFGAGIAWEQASSRRDLVPPRSLLIQGRARVFYQPAPWLALGVEAAGSGSPYDTVERYLGGLAGNLWFGGKFLVAKNWILELALVEELASWASVEVGFQAGFSWSPPLPRGRGSDNFGLAPPRPGL